MGTLAWDEAFEEAFDRIYPRALRLARRILGSPAASEDVAAEALARTLERWHRVRDLPYLDAWVLRVVANLALSDIRRRHRASPAAFESQNADPAIRLALAAVLARLPRRQRDAIVLRYLCDLTEADAARSLGCAPGTLKSHLHRGLVSLRRQLAASGEEVDLAFD